MAQSLRASHSFVRFSFLIVAGLSCFRSGLLVGICPTLSMQAQGIISTKCVDRLEQLVFVRNLRPVPGGDRENETRVGDGYVRSAPYAYAYAHVYAYVNVYVRLFAHVHGRAYTSTPDMGMDACRYMCVCVCVLCCTRFWL